MNKQTIDLVVHRRSVWFVYIQFKETIIVTSSSMRCDTLIKLISKRPRKFTGMLDTKLEYCYVQFWNEKENKYVTMNLTEEFDYWYLVFNNIVHI